MARWWPAIRTLSRRCVASYRPTGSGESRVQNGYRDPLLVILCACRGFPRIGVRVGAVRSSRVEALQLSCTKWDFMVIATTSTKGHERDTSTFSAIEWSQSNRKGLVFLRWLPRTSVLVFQCRSEPSRPSWNLSTNRPQRRERGRISDQTKLKKFRL